MHYALRHRPLEKQIVAAARRMGQPIPPPFDNPPTIPLGCDIFVEAFNDLNAERAFHNDFIEPISRRDVRGWAESFGYGRDHDFMQELYAYIRAMDPVQIKYDVEERRKARAKARAKAKQDAAAAKGVSAQAGKSQRKRQEVTERD